MGGFFRESYTRNLPIIFIRIFLHKINFYRGPQPEISEGIFSNIMDLDISETLVPTWEACCSITINLKRLKTLTVSNNRWPISSDPDEKSKLSLHLSNSLPNLEELDIGQMNYNWTEVFLIASSLPKLRYYWK